MNRKEPMTNLERSLETRLRQLAPSLPPPVWHHRFRPGRKQEIDAAWPAFKVGVEVQGGIYGRPIRCPKCKITVGKHRQFGGHQTTSGIVRDIDKHNAAIAMGWLLLYYSAEDEKDPMAFTRLLVECYESRLPNQCPGGTPETPTERSAMVGWMLGLGVEMTTQQIADLTGLETRGARRMMARLSRVLPICREGGEWIVVRRML